MLLALLVFTAVFFLPAVGRLIPLGDLDLLQLPNMLLSLMLVWAAHKKLLELFLTGVLVFTASQYYFYTAMPGAMEEGIWAVTSVILIVFTPFLFLVFWSNAFYFQHAKRIIESICLHFHDDSERMLLVKKQGGTSVRLASLTAAGLALYFLHMIPEQGSLQSKLATLMGKQAPMAYEQELAQAQQRASRSQQFFTDAERHYHAAAPNYRRAAEAYYAAMDAGSLLAAYKLAYMHLHGQGVARNDSKALHFFHQAIKAPLSSQPHQLSVATHWLAESYASLGIMYLAAYGTKSDQNKSGKMFQQAAQFGVPNRRLDAIRAGFRRGDNLRQLVSAPNFN